MERHAESSDAPSAEGSHGIFQRPRSTRLLVAIDPRRSETSAIADIHLAVRPGTDSLLMKAMISIILENGWEAKDYIGEHVLGSDLGLMDSIQEQLSMFANLTTKRL